MAYAPPISRPSAPEVKSTATVRASTTAASGRCPRSSAHSGDESSTTDAPSDSGVEFPAVIVAGTSRSFPNTGFSDASFSSEVSGRSDSSRASPRYGVIRPSKKPRS